MLRIFCRQLELDVKSFRAQGTVEFSAATAGMFRTHFRYSRRSLWSAFAVVGLCQFAAES